jgi:4-phytase/acid phosphatase
MELFGAYDRNWLAHEGLLSPEGCSDAAKITIYADSDQRTRETGKAGAHGLMPGCNLAVQTLPEGTNDPVFHVPGSESSDRERARVAVAGRLGGDPANLTLTYREQLQTLDHVLATCGIRRLPPYAA